MGHTEQVVVKQDELLLSELFDHETGLFNFSALVGDFVELSSQRFDLGPGD